MRWSVFWRAERSRWYLSYGPAPGTQRVIPPGVACGPGRIAERAANEWARDKVAEIERGQAPEPEPSKIELTIAELVPKWLELMAQDPRLSAATRGDYSSHLRLSVVGYDFAVEPSGKPFGARKPSELDVPSLRKWVRELRSKRSPSTTRNRFSTLSSFLDDCNAEGWTDAPNLCRSAAVRAEIPELPLYRAKVISLADYAALLNCFAYPPVRRIRYLLAGLAGLCDGEIAGVKVRDTSAAPDVSKQGTFINGLGGLLTIRQSVAVRGPKGWASEGKLKNKYRTRQLPMHPMLEAGIRSWIEHGWEEHVCRRPADGDWLVPNDNGEAWRPKSADWLRCDLAAAGVQAPPGFAFKDLRACFATWLEESGASEGCRARMLGHRGKTTAAVHYTAALIAADREAVSRIIVPDLVPAALYLSHLRDLNSRPTVYESVRSVHETAPAQRPSTPYPSSVGARNGRESSNGSVPRADIVPSSEFVPDEIVELQRGLRGLVTPWDALELYALELYVDFDA